MYKEIIQSLMLSKMIGMVLLFALAIVGFAVFYVIFERRNKKKRQNQKKKLSRKEKLAAEKDKNESFIGALIIAVCICLLGCLDLYDYLSLREDMVSENYVTFTGEFRYEETYRKNRITHEIVWEDEKGKTQVITYDYAIDDYQPNNVPLEEGNYRGTIVYSPTGKYLLWWDAVPIGD